jgi:hypothetical protein
VNVVVRGLGKGMCNGYDSWVRGVTAVAVAHMSIIFIGCGE